MSSHTVSDSRRSSSPQAWDGLSEQERRQLLDSMDPEAVRSMAASMPVIEQAKGIVMGCYGGDATAAFAVLTQLSSSSNLKLRDVAALVVEAASTGSTAGSAPLPLEQVRRVLCAGQPDGGRAVR